MHFIDLMKARRSRYLLTDRLPVSQAELEKILAGCVKHVPSAFNAQSARVVLLLGPAHKKLWDIVLQSLREIVPDEKFAPAREKTASFSAAYGTVLYFEDTSVTRAMRDKFPAYKDNFPLWAQQAAGMLQFAVWTAFAEAGIGASLQHYNPLIDRRVRKAFHIPSAWTLLAQMPFGEAEGKAPEKTFLPLSLRLRVER